MEGGFAFYPQYPKPSVPKNPQWEITPKPIPAHYLSTPNNPQKADPPPSGLGNLTNLAFAVSELTTGRFEPRKLHGEV